MARKLRLEYAGAVYHVINRGNYRGDIFRDDGAKQAFLACLDEACEKAGWRVHAWAVMSNHYHLALETPQANLVAGMQWLQGTFALRFNRFRREAGHLFQGRYKSLVVDPGSALGPLCHYLHLNPVRARMVPIAQLAEWPWTSFRWLMAPKERAAWFQPATSLGQAGGLADTKSGHRKYTEYLAWLAEEKPEQKRLGFERMSKGWVLGSRDFKQDLVKEHREAAESLQRGERDLEETRIARLDERLEELLAALDKSRADLTRDRKSAPWKVAVAAEMKATTTATNGWLSDTLAMGSPYTVSRLAGSCRRAPGAATSFLRKMANSKA